MKILTVYYSLTKNNETIAKELHRRLGGDIWKLTEKKDRSRLTIFLDVFLSRTPKIDPVPLPLDDYDHMVLVAPIWVGEVATPMHSFLKKYGSGIKSYSYITLSSGLDGQMEKIVKAMEKTLGTPPVAVKELRICDLVSPEKKETRSPLFDYQLNEDGLNRLNGQMENFIESVQGVFV